MYGNEKIINHFSKYLMCLILKNMTVFAANYEN